MTLIADLTGLTSSGASGTRWVALDANGAVYIEELADQRSLDVASVTWNGTIFTGSPTHLAHVLFDGDSWAEVRERAVTPDIATFAAYTFRRGAERIRALELFLSGHSTGAEGEAIAGPLVGLPGTEANPSIILADGSSTWDTDTGWYRYGAGQWGFSGGGSLRFRLSSTGMLWSLLGSAANPAIRATSAGVYFPSAQEIALAAETQLVIRCKAPTSLPQALFPYGTVAAPGIGFDQDEDTGLYAPAVGELAVTLAGTKRFHLAADQARFRDGAVGAPALAFDADLDTGFYRPGDNRLAAATAGVPRLELDAAGNLDLPTNMGAIVRRASAQTSLASGSSHQISWDTEDRDIGGWIAVTSTDLTVPSDGDGLYAITLEVVWDNAATPAGLRECWIEAAGSNYCPHVYDAWADRDHELHSCTIVSLSASDVVRGIVRQSQGSALDLLEARLAIQKIA